VVTVKSEAGGFGGGASVLTEFGQYPEGSAAWTLDGRD